MQPDSRRRQGIYGTPSPSDWSVFLAWARREGWRVPAREVSLYRHELADSAFVLHGADAAPLGFITVCRHRRGAWIGNLIVDPARRGAGHGRRLFEHAVATLSCRGTDTFWLTASCAGRRLYESCGFHEAGRIERWTRQGDGPADHPAGPAAAGGLSALLRADARAWGDSRASLLSMLARSSHVVASGCTIAMVQPSGDLTVIGPWLSDDLCPRANRAILAFAVEAAGGCGTIAVDIAGGSPIQMLLSAGGFRQSGETALMVRGAPGPVRFGKIVALASLGSMG